MSMARTASNKIRLHTELLRLLQFYELLAAETPQARWTTQREPWKTFREIGTTLHELRGRSSISPSDEENAQVELARLEASEKLKDYVGFVQNTEVGKRFPNSQLTVPNPLR